MASNEIFSPTNKIHREVGRTKDLSARRYVSQGRGITRFFYCGSCLSKRDLLHRKIQAFISVL
jgi:hypothetical protein